MTDLRAPSWPLMLDDPPEARPSAEARLVAAARGGDGRAFGSLVRPHLPMLYRVAARACGRGNVAEDAVQEALAIAARRLGRYEPDTSLRAFLAGIVVKRVFTLLRSDARRRKREGVANDPASPASPFEELEASRLEARIRDALRGLPRKRREAVLLRLDGKLTDDEIARSLGSTPGSVRVLVHLGLKALRSELGLDDHGDDR